MNKLILIDGNSISNRAFYALPLLNNDKGQYTNAVLGFTTMLLRVLEEEEPTHILVAFDAGKTTFRHNDYKDYKAKRQKTPPELSEQFPMIQNMLDGFSIKHYQLKNYEADDIIGTLAKQANQEGWQTKIITGDKDMFQLVSPHVQVSFTRKGISEVDDYNAKKLDERYQLTPAQIVDLKGLMGDSSDNIPGVPGVGEKTALKLLHQYETIENLYEHIDDISGKLKDKLADNKEQAFLSKQLATIMCDAPVDVQLENITYAGYTQEHLMPILEEYGFKQIIERIGGPQEEAVDIQDVQLTQLADPDSPQWKKALLSPAALYVEVLADHYQQADVQGISICNEQGLFYTTLEVAQASPVFLDWLADESQKKWVFNAKRTQVVLKWKDITIQGIECDHFLAAYLLNPTQSSYTLAAIAQEYGQTPINSDEQVYGKGAKQKLPDSQEELIQHIARKSQTIYECKSHLEQQLKEHNLYALLDQLELPVSKVLGEMEIEGVRVDQKQLQDMDKELTSRVETLTKDIYDLAGVEFNINSPKQLGNILFDKLELPVLKKTKTGYSTNAEVLEKLEPQHEIIGHILLYRQLVKLQSTYVEGLLKEVNAQTQKVHTIFQQTIAATGRLSSTNPNLQNIPIRLEEGRKIRKAFVAKDDEHLILAADYSQIELRVLAHLSEDEGLIEAFRDDQDIHTKTAMDVFHVDQQDVTSLMRRHAKAVNFGVIYGISDYGLSQNLNISRKEAGEFIDRYFTSFPGVKTFMESIVKQAKKDGFVTTLLHRRRYLPEINSRNFNLRSFAERTAMNTPIQGTAADIIKKAMIDVAEQLQLDGIASKLLLQVHDELIFEVPKKELEKLKKLVRTTMEATIELNVPLKVDMAYGSSWYEAK